MVGPISEVHNASEVSQSPTSTPQSPDSQIPALVPSASAEGVDTNPNELISTAPNGLTALPEPQRGERAIAQGEALGVDPPVTSSPEGATQSNDHKTLEDLLRAESTLAAAIATLDPLSPAFIQSLQSLATLRYHITAARADIAAAQNPKYLKELTKATAIVQRDHLRLAREHSANEREHSANERERLRREREDRAAQRANEKQEHQERMAKHKIHLEELRLRREQEKTYNNIHKQSHKNLQLESNAIAARDAAKNDPSQSTRSRSEFTVTTCSA